MSKKRNNLTKEECQEKALLCKTRSEFEKTYNSHYKKAKRENWLDDICPHMEILLNNWTKEECQEKALLCESRSEFKKTYNSHYNKALRENWLDDICPHMTTIVLVDTVYIWNTLENPQLWKIGISNHYTVENRINKVGKEGNITPHSKYWKVFEDDNVYSIEKELLKLGEPYQFTTPFDGHTEFRLLTAEEEQYMKSLIA
jgi:hypothetical protein